MISGLGRYGYGRRTDQVAGIFNEVNLLAAIQAFGGPPMWEAFPANTAGISPSTQEIWIPAGILLAYFSDVRLWYVSGYQQSALPSPIKQATAMLINSLYSNPQFQGQISAIGAGNQKQQRFMASALDDDMKSMLNAYRVITVI